MEINLVGLDPSLRNLGIAQVRLDINNMTFKVDNLILVRTENEKDKAVKKVVRKNSEDLQRAGLLHRGMLDGCKDAFLAVAEVPVGSQSSRAMASYGICIGVLAACPIPLIQVTPTEVKLAGYGNKTATKGEMIEWATSKYPGANWLTQNRKGVKCYIDANEHLADALGAIEAGVRTAEFTQLVAMFRAAKAFGASPVSHA